MDPREATEEERAAVMARLGPRFAEEARHLAKRMDNVVTSDATRKRKFIRIVQLAHDFSAAISHATACRGAGCSHCCYQAVNITQREADRIGEHLGRAAVQLPVEDDPGVVMRNLDADVERYTGKACPFLVGGLCSIYEVRPVACIVAHSLEATPDKCKLDRPQHVLRLKTHVITGPLALLDMDMSFADIRDYFP